MRAKLLIKSFLLALAVMAGGMLLQTALYILTGFDARGSGGFGMGVLALTFGLASWKQTQEDASNEGADHVRCRHCKKASDAKQDLPPLDGGRI